MSNRYKGAIISATPPTTTGGPSGVASGAWTLEQQMQLQAAGLWPSQPPPPYIEDVFSTYLYTGNGATQTITNGIDLSTKGGLVWLKDRIGATSHQLYDTQRGVEQVIYSNRTDASSSSAETVTAFNTTGFTVGQYGVNSIGQSAVSWTFRKAPKFFDVVTVTGNGASTQTINHSLGSAPAVIIYKPVSSAGGWIVYHQSIPNSFSRLNTTAVPSNAGLNRWNPTSTTFDATSYYGNDTGETYVAYLFAHNAGGFGLTGTDNVISCGTYTGNGSFTGPVVTLGYEPQWILVKNISDTYDWQIIDNMRGMALTSGSRLFPNLSDAEQVSSSLGYIAPTATGFQPVTTLAEINQSGSTFIYIAIRRGPMKVPTTGTSVFSPIAYTGNGGTQNLTTNFAGDMAWIDQRTSAGQRPQSFDKLRGGTQAIYQSSTSAEQTNSPTSNTVTFNNTQTVLVGPYSQNGIYNDSGQPQIAWNFKRAPSFFDEVCYTGDGTTNRSVNHNLTVVPEIILVKRRSAGQSWLVWGTPSLGAGNYLILNTTAASANAGTLIPSTSTTFGAQDAFSINDASVTYVAYLFATCAGVSKVGSYTGNGTTQTIDCGFGAGGARFVLIKRTDSTGDWYVYDTARGMTVLTDPYLLLNSTAAEVATLGSVTTVSTGFAVNASVLAAINTNAASYIFLAIA